MKLTKADKDFLINKVLREAFKLKFDEWEKDIKERIQAKVYLEHPTFERLLKDKETRPYLYITSPHYVNVNDVTPRMPDYQGYINEWINFRSIDVPQKLGGFKFEDKYYSELCDKYREAYAALRRMLNSYTTREKFLVDFPEYKDYLPIVTKVGLPAIIPAKVRAELSELLK